MKLLSILLLLSILTGCPVYDLPSGLLRIKNETDAPVYVYLTCTGSLSPDLPLKVYFPKAINNSNNNNPTTDSANTNPFPKLKLPIIKPLTSQDSILANAVDYYPYNRIKTKSIGSIAIGGSPDKPDFSCENDQINIFFITEKTLQHNSWAKICKNGLYEKRQILSSKQLESKNWEVEYNSK